MVRATHHLTGLQALYPTAQYVVADTDLEQWTLMTGDPADGDAEWVGSVPMDGWAIDDGSAGFTFVGLGQSTQPPPPPPPPRNPSSGRFSGDN
jgi:hypothetical protein